MIKRLLKSLILVALIISACTPTIYGVPEERWQQMSEPERIAVLEAYQARQAVRQEQLRERARQRAREAEARQAREAEEERQRQRRIEAIYRGEGVYGDLLRVTLQDGLLKFSGAHQAYLPVAFPMAAGETRQIQLISRNGRRASLQASYDGSSLILDDDPRAQRVRGIHLEYTANWSRGMTYTDLISKGPLELRGASVRIEVIGEPPRNQQVRSRQRIFSVRKAPRHDHRQNAAVDQDLTALRPPGSPTTVTITFQDGKINHRGKSYRLIPKSADLHEGESRSLILQGKRGSVTLQISYHAGDILLDDQSGQPGGTIRLSWHPDWKNGHVYRLAESAHRQLENLDILILAK